VNILEYDYWKIEDGQKPNCLVLHLFHAEFVVILLLYIHLFKLLVITNYENYCQTIYAYILYFCNFLQYFCIFSMSLHLVFYFSVKLLFMYLLHGACT